MAMTELFLGIDGGATKTVAVLGDGDGKVLGRGEAGGSNYHAVGVATASANVLAAADAARQAAGLRPRTRLRCAYLGLAGVRRPEDFDAWTTALRPLKLAVKVRLDHDAAVAHAGAFSGGPGVMVLAGTGAVVFGVDAPGTRADADGWGPLLGDRGSGYWIAAHALQAACEAWDGTGPPTVLTSKFLEAFGLSWPRRLVPIIYGSGRGASDIAALAHVVVEGACEGDTVARRILRDAGRELAQTTTAVIDRLSFPGNVPVSSGGALLLNCPEVRASWRRLLLRKVPQARIAPAQCPPEEGALLLAKRASERSGPGCERAEDVAASGVMAATP